MGARFFVFLSHGFGLSAFYHGKPVSECTFIFTGDKRAEMDITTQAGFRGMGLARMTAKAFINHCLTCDLTPGWDVNNMASVSLAEKLGFNEPATFSVFVKT
ncbi:GNAT family N-acetyltransferase [Bacillus sp. ISL-51]|uniref:GNAT family N-acetyltransferase n=1 Tax=Bacteria TaxID=2 RepID=UPI001BE8A0D0|nr:MULTISPECIES: GNAT family N-acetyltransferase [unclassified Bacillus (in: firmicutes)]MBT2573090.1 GNAT family N-acetyltransferase [Bacillus sp. ISL-51]MBT2634994.1 GNAT family N-acetyltransferase [Bacillus sp. ISL-26]MBT2712090.1 GNAT family N-acetyltransferase [Pseudomonas sp. ISL-88]